MDLAITRWARALVMNNLVQACFDIDQDVSFDPS
jgi:hypothetical protein